MKKWYFFAWLNEAVKVAMGILTGYASYLMWNYPPSETDKSLGVAIGVLLLLSAVMLVDAIVSVWHLRKGEHHLIEVGKARQVLFG